MLPGYSLLTLLGLLQHVKVTSKKDNSTVAESDGRIFLCFRKQEGKKENTVGRSVYVLYYQWLKLDTRKFL